MKTWATKQINLKGHSREEQIASIADIDGVGLAEAESRLDWAIQSKARRSKAMFISYEAGRAAERDARSGFYNHQLADRYKRYRRVYWETRAALNIR